MSIQTSIFRKIAKEATEESPHLLGKMMKNKEWVILNAIGAVSDYNTSRSEGKGRLRSAADAGAQFVTYELLGKAAFPFIAATALPSVAVSGIEKVDQMSRQMNLINRNLPFANSRFYDTKQGYTMRQQGMALAKNSRYQLEQTLMGNEAQYLKR